VTTDVTQDLETRVRLFASEQGRVPTAREVRALMAELGLTRDSVADLAEDVASSNSTSGRLSVATPRTEDVLRSPLQPARSVDAALVPQASGHRSLAEPEETVVARAGGWAATSSSVSEYEVNPPSAVLGASSPPPHASADAIVRRAVDDLTDDWHRQDGRLADDDVTRLVSKRGLSAPQQAAALAALADLGISVEPSEPRSRRVSNPVETPEAVETLAATTLSSDQLKDYLKAIGRTPLLFAEDEVRLGRAIQAGLNAETELADAGSLPSRTRNQLESIAAAGRQAQRDLVQANLRLVVSIAKLRAYEGQGLDLPDRIQEGSFGLMRAAVKFDPNLGYKFSTYATWWIRQSISRGLADRGRLIRLPVHVVENLNKIRGARRSLASRYDRKPTLAELAEATGLAEATVRAILDYDRHVGSLDAPVASTDGDLTFGDLLSDEADVDGRNDPVDCALASAMRRDLDDLLDGVLDDRARDVLERRNGYEGGVIRTLDDLGKEYRVTRERIRQVESKAYSVVRSTPGVLALYEYLCNDLTDGPPTPPGDRKTGDTNGAGSKSTGERATTPAASPGAPASEGMPVQSLESPSMPLAAEHEPAAPTLTPHGSR
jgi:RNA polymerase primary sigma factor